MSNQVRFSCRRSSVFSLAIVAALLFSSAAGAAESATAEDLSAWLKSMLVRVAQMTNAQVQESADAGNVPVAVAGLRGSEQKKDMEPYWKGTLTTRSVDYLAYRQIEQKMQAGDYKDALRLTKSFQKEYARSKLVPEVLFTSALAYTGVGQSKEALGAFEDLVKRYPEHDLATPSKEGISRLRKA